VAEVETKRGEIKRERDIREGQGERDRGRKGDRQRIGKLRETDGKRWITMQVFRSGELPANRLATLKGNT
jgi:hypothetical protein